MLLLLKDPATNKSRDQNLYQLKFNIDISTCAKPFQILKQGFLKLSYIYLSKD